jgi:hypothetical protein
LEFNLITCWLQNRLLALALQVFVFLVNCFWNLFTTLNSRQFRVVRFLLTYFSKNELVATFGASTGKSSTGTAVIKHVWVSSGKKQKSLMSSTKTLCG